MTFSLRCEFVLNFTLLLFLLHGEIHGSDIFVEVLLEEVCLTPDRVVEEIAQVVLPRFLLLGDYRAVGDTLCSVYDLMNVANSH